MKFILVLALVHGALGQCPEDGCAFLQECAEVKTNNTLSRCISNNGKLCELWGQQKTAWAVRECQTTQSCCGGDCCNPGEVCIVQRSGSFTYEGEIYDAQALERNGWKFENGERIKYKPKYCYQEKFNAAKVIFLPVACVVVVLIAVVTACGAGADISDKSHLPAFIVIICSVILIFSNTWPYAVVMALTAAVTMVTNDSKAGWMLLFQIVVAWILLGGSTFPLGSLGSFLDVVTDTVAQQTTSCANYFDYFRYEAVNRPFSVGAGPIGNRPWNINEDFVTWGLCGAFVVGLQSFVGVISLLAFVLMTAQTAFSFMSAGKADMSKSDSAA